MADKLVLVGVLPESTVLAAGEQAVWFCNSGSLKIEFDPQRCPFSSNVFQAPANVRIESGTMRPGTRPGAYKYRLSVNDAVLAQGEIIIRPQP